MRRLPDDHFTKLARYIYFLRHAFRVQYNRFTCRETFATVYSRSYMRQKRRVVRPRLAIMRATLKDHHVLPYPVLMHGRATKLALVGGDRMKKETGKEKKS